MGEEKLTILHWVDFALISRAAIENVVVIESHQNANGFLRSEMAVACMCLNTEILFGKTKRFLIPTRFCYVNEW